MMKFATLVTAATATATAIQLNPPHDLNLEHKNNIQHPPRQIAGEKFNLLNNVPNQPRQVRPPFLNHQLNVDHMEVLNRVHQPRTLENEPEKSYYNGDEKDVVAPFTPPFAPNSPVENENENGNEYIVDGLPFIVVDESTQVSESDLETPPLANMMPEPKEKPMPKEKPGPGGPPPLLNNNNNNLPPPPPPIEGKPAPGAFPPPPAGGKPAPVEKGAPKPKPEPRTLFSLLGFPDASPPPPPPPGGIAGGKPKPGPKGKPMPQVSPQFPPPPDFFKNQPAMNFPSMGDVASSSPPFFPQSDENAILRARMNLLSSPHSEDYSDQAYVTIQAVQDYCAVDYTTFCSPMFLMNSISSPVFAPPKLVPFGNWDDDQDGDDDSDDRMFIVGVVNSVFDLFNSVFGISPTTVVVVQIDDDETPIPQSPCSKGSQIAPQLSQQATQERVLLRESHHSHSHSHESEFESEHFEGPRSRNIRRDPDAKPKPKPHPQDGGFFPWGSPSENSHSGDSSGSSGSGDSSMSESFFLPDPVFPSPTFLGYGQDGDMCLMANYESLSMSCQSAIDDAYVLRDQYVAEEENGGGCAFAAGILTTLALVSLCLCISRGRRQKIIATFKAIHNDPELKARVEAASGIPVPLACCAKKDGDVATQPCRFRKCLTFLLRVCFTLLISVVLVHIAARITIEIANSMIYTNEETGEVTEPSPISVLLIFISFLIVEILLIAAIRNFLVGYAIRRRRVAFASSGTSSAPPTVSSSAAPVNRAPTQNSFGRYLPAFQLPTNKFSFFRTTNVKNGYSPLMTDEENNTEMIQSPTVVIASAPLQHQVLYVPPTMPSHVTAQSISSVSMI